MFEKYVNWPFLQEPIWRWAIFVLLLIVIFFMWSTIIAHMKAATV